MQLFCHFLVTCKPTRIKGRPLVHAFSTSELQHLLLSYMNERILAQYLNFHAETVITHCLQGRKYLQALFCHSYHE